MKPLNVFAGLQIGSHQASRRLLQSSPSPPKLIPSLEPPSAPSPQQPDAAPARQRRVKKDVEIAVAVTIGLILLVGGVFCLLAVVCRCVGSKMVIWVRLGIQKSMSSKPDGIQRVLGLNVRAMIAAPVCDKLG